MDTFDLFTQMRKTFRRIERQCTSLSPSFRDGTARATWLEDGVNWAFDGWVAQLTLLWLLSDDTHTLDLSDFDVGEDFLTEMGLIGPSRTLADIEAAMTERNRTKLLNFFRTDMEDAGLNVGQRLGAVAAAMNAAKATALGLLDTTGDATTIKYVEVGGVKKKVGKTLTEMGLNGAPLADALDALAVSIAEVVRVA